MNATRRSAALAMVAVLLGAGAWLWTRHARAWDLGGGSPILGYDAAQYAVAARELAEHGRLATPFALPLELARHATPPWPLALVQPGLVAVEAALFRLAAPPARADGAVREPAEVAARRQKLVLAFPLACYLATGALLALATFRLLARGAPSLSAGGRAAAGGVVGLAFLLDPEAQHFAAGGFTELPFTLGLAAAVATLASGGAARRPLVFGLLLGVTGAFRGTMLWLAPALVGAAAAAAPAGRRATVVARALAGYALPLAPWWIYKWRAFGSPGWDLSWISLWDGVEGRTWFSLNHLAELPELPVGTAAVSAIAAKVAGNLPPLLLDLSIGPRGLWIGALLFWIVAARGRGPLAAAGLAAIGALAASAVVAAASVPLLRYVFPARAVFEAAGVLALWGLLARAPEALVGGRARRALEVGVAVLALTWGAVQTGRGWREAGAAAAGRGIPTTATLLDLAERLDREVPPGEPVMSNLGPVLAWFGRRPVVHLALSPADVDACRRRLDLRHVVLVFRSPERAWSEWVDVLRRPAEAERRPEWNVVRARRFETGDGFAVVWLELGPLAPRLARSAARPPAGPRLKPAAARGYAQRSSASLDPVAIGTAVPDRARTAPDPAPRPIPIGGE